VDVRALAFSALVAMLTGILFGMLPAVQAMGADVDDALKDGAQALTVSRGGRRLRSGLVVAATAPSYLGSRRRGALLGKIERRDCFGNTGPSALDSMEGRAPWLCPMRIRRMTLTRAERS
jgi:hypothetical protein